MLFIKYVVIVLTYEKADTQHPQSKANALLQTSCVLKKERSICNITQMFPQNIKIFHSLKWFFLPWHSKLPSSRFPGSRFLLSTLHVYASEAFCQQLWQWLDSVSVPVTARQARLLCGITVWSRLRLPGELSCPTVNPLQPGQSWQHLSPRSCWRLWWQCLCAHPWDCNTLHSHLAPLGQST